MKIHAFVRRTAGLAGSSRFSVLGASLLALALLGPLHVALGDGGFMSGGGDGDAIGSLPSSKPDDPSAGAHGVVPGAAADFHLDLVGQLAEIQPLLVSAGSGQVSIEALDDRGTVRLSVLGTSEVVLDRAQLATSAVRVEVRLGHVFDGGLAYVKVGQRSAQRALHAGALDLHLVQLDRSGLLEQGVELLAVTPQRHASGLKALAGASWVVLQQTP